MPRPVRRPLLTGRQQHVLDLIRAGRSNREIAVALGITEHGVKAHVARLFSKFDVPNRAALVAAASAPRGQRTTEQALRQSLSEVLGAPTANALIRRAARRAGVGSALDEGALTFEEFQALLLALWPLLIEMTGQTVLTGLSARGIALPAPARKDAP